MLRREKLTALVRSCEVDAALLFFTDPNGRKLGRRFDANCFLKHAHIFRTGQDACGRAVTGWKQRCFQQI